MEVELWMKAENDQVKKLYENHKTFNDGDAGLDLFCLDDVLIKKGETKFIDLKVKCEMVLKQNSENLSYYLYPRSSISKTPLRLANSVGIIDAGYRGNLRIALDNIKDEDYTLKKGTRLVQICSPFLSKIKLILKEDLSETERGEGGYGSTGV